MTTVNSIKELAVKVLLDETFSHINKEIHEIYVTLAKENSLLRNIESVHFLYDGIVYPTRNVNGTIKSNKTIPGLPTLHYSLLEDLDKANRLSADAGFNYIKNYFVAVITHSYNGLVLDALLPAMLINTIKRELSPEEFYVINNTAEPLVDTKINIARIKNHYSETIINLRKVMIDKLLLEG